MYIKVTDLINIGFTEMIMVERVVFVPKMVRLKSLKIGY